MDTDFHALSGEERVAFLNSIVPSGVVLPEGFRSWVLTHMVELRAASAVPPDQWLDAEAHAVECECCWPGWRRLFHALASGEPRLLVWAVDTLNEGCRICGFAGPFGDSWECPGCGSV